MAVYVGENKAVAYHGDSHPLNVYQGKRKITGYNTPTLTGKGRVAFEAPYNAALPSVEVRGEGQQEKLEGKNLFSIDMKHDFWRVPNSGLCQYDIALKPNTAYTLSTNCPMQNVASLYFNGTSTYDNGVFAEKPRTVTTDSTGKVYILVRYRDAEGEFNLYTPVKDGALFIQLEEGSTPTPYEPYCGGIPAPNPQYPIEPVFLEGAELTVRGHNLADPTDYKVFPQNIQLYRANGKKLRAGKTYCFDDNISQKNRIIYLNAWPSTSTRIISASRRPLIYTPTEDQMVWVDFYWYSARPVDVAIQIEISSAPTPYEPFYDGGTAQLPILRALPDGSVRDEIDLRTGTVTKNVETTDLSALPVRDWTYKSGAEVDLIAHNLFLSGQDRQSAPICTISEGVSFDDRNKIKFCCFINSSNNQIILKFNKGSFPDLQSWLAFISNNNAVVWHKNKTPIIEHYDPAILRQHPGYTQLIQQGGELQAPIEATAYVEEKI